MKKIFYIIRNLALTASLVLYGHGCNGQNEAKAGKNQKDPVVAVMSFNIRYINDFDGDNSWANRREACINVIRIEKPDVIGFQEPRGEQVGYLLENLPDYGSLVLDRKELGIANEGHEPNMLMYNKKRFDMVEQGYFWLSETPDVPSRGWDAAQRRNVVWVRLREKESGKELWFFNTHFDHKGKEARLNSSELMVRRITDMAGNKATVFLTADFNAASSAPVLVPLMQFMGLARNDAPVTDQLRTFNGFGTEANGIIDHIFYRKARAIEYETLSGNYGVPYVSDHYPIMATFQLR